MTSTNPFAKSRGILANGVAWLVNFSGKIPKGDGNNFFGVFRFSKAFLKTENGMDTFPFGIEKERSGQGCKVLVSNYCSGTNDLF